MNHRIIRSEEKENHPPDIVNRFNPAAKILAGLIFVRDSNLVNFGIFDGDVPLIPDLFIS